LSTNDCDLDARRDQCRFQRVNVIWSGFAPESMPDRIKNIGGRLVKNRSVLSRTFRTKRIKRIPPIMPKDLDQVTGRRFAWQNREPQKLSGSVALIAFADHKSGGNVEGREILSAK
jgi:hypothetical protein